MNTMNYALKSGTVETIEGEFETKFRFKVLICTEKEFMNHVYEMAQSIVKNHGYCAPNPMIITTKEPQ